MHEQCFSHNNKNQKLDGGQDERVQDDLIPVSIIDVVFLLLLFFFVRDMASGSLPGAIRNNKSNGDVAPVALPEVERVVAAMPSNRLLFRIEPASSGTGYMYYFLDQDDSDAAMMAAKEWTGHIWLSLNDPLHAEDAEFIARYNGAVPGLNIVRKYGFVGSDNSDFSKLATSMALYLRHAKQDSGIAWLSKKQIAIKADRSVPIGLMREVMRVCDDSAIRELKLIVHQKLK